MNHQKEQLPKTKNIKLKEELTLKIMELGIDAALEKVCARTMVMNKVVS